jgi:exopolysaccharide production protein ExoQ
VSSLVAAVLVFAALFAAAFIPLDHRLSAPRNWQRSTEIDFAGVRQQTLHGTTRRRVAFIALFVAFIFVMLWIPFRVRLQLTPIVVATTAWLGWETCSVLWSVNTPLSLRRLPSWIITAMVGVLAGAALGVKGCLMAMALVCAAYLVAGVANELLNGTRDPEIGYRFAGTLHPNQQALNCALLAFSSCWLGATESIPSGIAIGGMIAGMGGLGLTRSRLAFWASETAALISIAMTPSGSDRTWPVGLAVGILVTGVAVRSLLGQVGVQDGLGGTLKGTGLGGTLKGTVLFGRMSYAASLNGRTMLWKLALADVGPDWILGQGFGAFWDVRRLDMIREKTGMRVWACHSTPVEIFVRSGAIGTVLFSATMVAAFIAALGLHGISSALFASLLIVIFLEGLLESFFALPSYTSLLLFLLLGALAVS